MTNVQGAGVIRVCLSLLLAGLALASPHPGLAAPRANALAGHASPYLAQHGADPVAWREWNADTLALAKRENKLLFVSVGYFSCHWCHVMQRQSYQDPAIARLLNEHFIPVKVDRELNAGLDAALIDFAERLKGVAGWPLNAFVTPEGYPAYAVLYEPPDAFKGILERMVRAWREKGQEFRQAARQAGAASMGPVATGRVDADVARQVRRTFQAALAQRADTLQGGFGQVSKFPMASHLANLLEYQARTPDPKLADFLRLTLDQMARLGLRDHVHGGFFRYTVDPDWSTPHFEKMLYDNAQLALVYARAARVLERPEYRAIAHQTLDFLLGHMAAPGGGFHTALSALDDRGREGGAYLWTREDLARHLDARQRDQASQLWALDQAAPFEDGHLPTERQASTAAERAALQAMLARLRTAGRQTRVPRDDKINAGLNGLALSALSQAGGDVPRFRQAARALRVYLEKAFLVEGRLLKTRAGNRVFPDAELEDYAYLAAGMLDHARAIPDAGAEVLARRLVQQAWPRFFGAAGWRREERPLLATLRPEPALADAALPSPSTRLMSATRELLARRPDPGLARTLNLALAMLPPVLAAHPFDHPGAVTLLEAVTGVGGGR